MATNTPPTGPVGRDTARPQDSWTELDSAIEKWTGLLKNAQFYYRMLHLPRDALDDEQKQNLRNIMVHLDVETDRPKKKPKVSRDAKRKQPLQRDAPDGPRKKLVNWSSVTKLERIVLAPVVAEHLQDHETDAVAFLEVSSPYEESTGPAAPQDALLTSFEYTTGLSDSTQKSQICTLFTWLFWYDVLKAARADCTGSRVTEAMVEQMLQKLTPNGDRSQCHDKLLAPQAVLNISQWATFGMKLQKVFVDAFGIGSLFFLHDKLTPNFMKNKVTLRGEEFDEAMAHLERLDLFEIVAEHKDVTTLGENIRACLKAPYPHMRAEGGGGGSVSAGSGGAA
ncbi:hypothetical protein P171DRAFT_432544 [Karstenula rhodostoma CBS 690.94]|uniref:Uncharacterized protein n=1 Tax=Karstenula rhodostoma CBS 690.94 TaxID=1392251 RepID=A0A9P4PGA5_9PLEO|nr:hypothetical protein P171DRAFT_432544 [Karstenula rhodostoma CBS 690.94]